MKIKRIPSIITALLVGVSPAFSSGIPVVDAAHIAANRVSHTIDYVQQVLHEANQQTQITHQLEQITQLYEQIDQLYQQIEQMDDYLERFGDPKSIVDLAGLDSLLGELGRSTEGLDIETKLPDIIGEDLFGFDGSGIFQPIQPDIVVGKDEVGRDAERYKPEDAARETIHQYREKKAEVMERRDAIRTEIAQTVSAIRSAETDSEVKKLTGVLLGQQTELQAVDQELEIAKGDSEARALENENQRIAEAKARAEETARRFEAANRADLQTYKIDQSRYSW